MEVVRPSKKPGKQVSAPVEDIQLEETQKQQHQTVKTKPTDTSTSSKHHFVAPQTQQKHENQTSNTKNISLPGDYDNSVLNTQDIDDDEEQVTEPNVFINYDETEDYKSHDTWQKVKSAGVLAKLKYVSYRTLDGLEYVGGFFAGFLGLDGSQHQYVVDAVEQIEYEERMEDEELQTAQIKREEALEEGYASTKTPQFMFAPGAPAASNGAGSNTISYV